MDANGIFSLLLLCSVTELCVLAIPEGNDSQQQQHTQNVYHDIGVTRNTIVTAQFECYQKIMKNDKHNKIGPVCNRTWDGWLCWEDTEAGFTTNQHCPDYFQDFDTAEMASKVCSETGNWFLHPESNRTWTNYTKCTAYTSAGRVTAMNLYYLVLIGHGLSLTSLFFSLGIFFHFKSLSCQRITLHKNLFFSFVLNSVITIIWLTAVASNQGLVQSNPVSMMANNQGLVQSNPVSMMANNQGLVQSNPVSMMANNQGLVQSNPVSMMANNQGLVQSNPVSMMANNQGLVQSNPVSMMANNQGLVQSNPVSMMANNQGLVQSNPVSMMANNQGLVQSNPVSMMTNNQGLVQSNPVSMMTNNQGLVQYNPVSMMTNNQGLIQPCQYDD
eukprot:XP_014007839.1 PREDICTED: calcitonin gene-related peptide type 1 receptor-like [Salmo salar]